MKINKFLDINKLKDMSLLILCSELDKHLGLFRDIESRNDVNICYIKEKGNKFPFNIIKRIFIGGKVNRYINMPFKSIWYQYEIPSKEFDKILVVANSYLSGWMPFLKRQKKLGKQINALLLDSMEIKSNTILTVKPILRRQFFDNIFSFDEFDVEKYGFIHSGYNYYSKLNCNLDTPIIRDLYFIGGIKEGRNHTLQLICNYINEFQS